MTVQTENMNIAQLAADNWLLAELPGCNFVYSEHD